MIKKIAVSMSAISLISAGCTTTDRMLVVKQDRAAAYEAWAAWAAWLDVA